MGQWDFAGDELLFFLTATVTAVVGACFWYGALVRRTPLRRTAWIRTALGAAPVVALSGLWIVLTRWANPRYVVGHLDYQLLFLSGGMAWIWVVAAVSPLLGISVTDDAIERSNPAAACVACGSVLGVMAIYAWSNVGSGPTIATTLVPALACTVAWLLLWFAVELLSRPSEAIAVDRDLPSGIRHAGMLVAMGLILGRAVAGDWISWRGTFTDMLLLGWPVVFLPMASAAIQLSLRPSAVRPQPGIARAGVVPAAVFLVMSIGYVVSLGVPDIGRHVVTYEEYIQSR